MMLGLRPVCCSHWLSLSLSFFLTGLIEEWNSVPAQYLSIYPFGVFPCFFEYVGSYAFAGTVWGGAWYPYCRCFVSWSWVFPFLFFSTSTKETNFCANNISTVALSTFPAGLYIFIEKFILRGNVAIIGARLVLEPSLLGWKKGYLTCSGQCLGLPSLGIRGH